MKPEAWFSPGRDVHVRIWLGDMVFDYAATTVAACHLVHDWTRKRWCTIEFIIHGAVEERLPLRRLPYERLFLGA